VVGPILLETSIDSSRERVYEVVRDMALRPAFTDHFQKDFRLARIESRGLGAAARFQISPPGPDKLWVETVITEDEPERLVVEQGRCGRLGRIPVTTTWTIVEGSDGTELHLSFETKPAHPLDRAIEAIGAQRWYKRKWGKALGRLTELVEGDQPLERIAVAGGDRASTGVF
jgi:hypothetical protein